MKYKSIELTIDDGLARLTFNQPDIGNVLDEIFSKEFCQVANELTSNSDVRVVLISAKGERFSLGGDLKGLSSDLDSLPENILNSVTGLHVGMARLMRLNAPIIASVQGAAMGGAVAILANCDLVLSSKSATFGAAYHYLALPCDLGATFGLASRMGLARARRFLLLGEVLDAETAATVGLVDKVVDDSELSTLAEKMATKLSKGPTIAYGMVRRLMAKSLTQPFESQLEDETQALIQAAASEDALEGINAFLEKRAPIFHGK